MFSDLDQKAVNTIRVFSADAIEKAKSGHPGLPMGAAPMAYVLWKNHLKHDPAAPHWADRDRFILSAGHGSMLLYSLLHLFGYGLDLKQIQNFRQWGSLTPGHPEFGLTPGVEATTGPLGQGTANAVGMAIAERKLAQLFNKEGFEIVRHFTYALVSDGDLMEGVSTEAASLAGHLKLGKLIYLYDANNVTLDGPTSMSFSTEDVGKRYESYGWQVIFVKDGDHDLNAIDQAIRDAKSDTNRPSLIIVRTTIGYGAPHKSGTSESHGAPLGKEELARAKKNLGFDPEKTFVVDDDVKGRFLSSAQEGSSRRVEWEQLFTSYKKAHPELAQQWEMALSGRLPQDWKETVPTFPSDESLATRVASGTIINALASKIPWFIGGDADLGSSTKTLIKNGGSFEGQHGTGRNIHFGVREHAMGAIANGILYHGGLRPFVSTFFCFQDYMRPAVRLAAMNHLPAIYIWTHDSIALGEDGPTHQPVEHLASLRCMPNMTVIRPADARETAEAWLFALEHTHGPTALVLTRQNVETLERPKQPVSDLRKGAYILEDSSLPRLEFILIATGSEVEIAREAKRLLEEKGHGTRVVSMPSWELFAFQDPSYQEKVLPQAVTRKISIEAGSTFGWERWTGSSGLKIGIDRFGASAPAEVLADQFGFTGPRVAEKVLAHFGSRAG